MDTLIYSLLISSLYFQFGFVVLITAMYWMADEMPPIKMQMNSQLEFLAANILVILFWPAGFYYIAKSFLFKNKGEPSEWD